MKKTYCKTINLFPSDFKCDVVITENFKFLDNLGLERYGLAEDVDPIRPDSCTAVITGINSQLKGKTVFVICLRTFEERIIVHEILHLLYQCSREIGWEMGADSQEWQCLMLDYIFAQITDRKGYNATFTD